MLFAILILILNCLGCRASTDQCAFPNERCSCVSGSPLCKCQYMTDQGTLNFTSGYQSHLVLAVGFGCQPCPPACLKCSSINSCQTCRSEYELKVNQCSPCPINCGKCSSGICEQCKAGFYLDSRAQCQSCPIEGTLQCSQQQLKSCLQSYWLDNNGATCINCDTNCLKCSSTTKCSICKPGFYLSSTFKCSLCMEQCEKCSNSTTCLTCIAQGHYYNSSSSSCTACPNYCLSCSNSTLCTACKRGAMISNGVCVNASSSQLIPNCYQNRYNSSTGAIECLECQSQYFMEVGTNSCGYGCSLLCANCSGAHYGLCSSCVQNSYLLNMHCLPMYNIDDGSAYQLFYTVANNDALFINMKKMTRLENACLQETVGLGAPSISLVISNPQAYKIILKWKVYILNVNVSATVNVTDALPLYSLAFTNRHGQRNYSFTADSSHCTCGSRVCIDKDSAIIDGDIYQQNYVQWTALSSEHQVGLSELLVVGHRCGGVQGATCAECEEIDKCTKCVNEQFYILGERCVIECPLSYYTYVGLARRQCYRICPWETYPEETSKQCFPCPSNCTGCSSPAYCYGCKSKHYLMESTGACLASCPSQYFEDAYRNKCEKCIYPCYECTSNLRCASCIFGFFQSLTATCVTVCPLGQYPDLKQRKCANCHPPCKQCQSVGWMCTSCIPNYWLLGTTCYQKCPPGYYPSGNATNRAECLSCSPQCLECTTNSTCISCKADYYLGGQCYRTCPKGYYNNQLDRSCSLCVAPCSICLSRAQCLQCVSPYKFLSEQFQCILQCPVYYYTYLLEGAHKSGSCLRCTPPCLTCASQYSCTSCYSAFLYEDQCLSECVAGTYPNVSSMTCVICPQNCTSCKSSSQCLTCASLFYIFNGNCLSSCPVSTYSITNTKYYCQACPEYCLSCLDKNYCLECIRGLVVNSGGKCTTVCQIGHFPDLWNTSQCLPCAQGCLLCDQYECQQCSVGLFLKNSTKCVSECDAGYFGAGSSCHPCVPPCQQCLSQLECTKCIADFGFYFMGDCVVQCPQTYFSSYVTMKCEPCHPSCISCMNMSSYCLQCRPQFYLSPTNECVSLDQCPRSYYAVSYLNQCIRCSSFCLSCRGNAHNCSECSPGYYKHEASNVCLQKCPRWMYANTTHCLDCSTAILNCTSCPDSSHCLACAANYSVQYYNQNGSVFSLCVRNCSKITFSKNGVCIECLHPCKQCESESKCLSCSEGYLYNAQCISSCPYGSYAEIDSQNVTLLCLPCSSQCDECISATQCLMCSREYLLINATCQDSCPVGMYSAFGVCVNCMYGCLNCTNAYQCNECEIGLLYEGECRMYCPYGLVPINSTCQQCSSQCLTCAIRVDLCISCVSGKYLYLGSCVDACQLGTYPVLEIGHCLTCSSPCSTCSNAYSCDSCIYGYILYLEQERNQCVEGPQCPNSYYLDLQENYCKLNCSPAEYTEPIKRTCSNKCPIGFVAYSQNMSCLYQCPFTSMWIDENITCQRQNRPKLLPSFSCAQLSVRNIMILQCQFSMEISNLDDLDFNNVELSSLQVQKIQLDSGSNRIYLIVSNRNLQSSKLVKQWMTISFRPRFSLLAAPQLQAINSSATPAYPVQNSDSTLFIHLFNFYSALQRQTGMYLLQISNSISLAALILWLFAFIQNKKVMSLIAITGIQWLFTLSLTANNLPPNIKQFLEGFKLGFLLRNNSDAKNNLLGRLWTVNAMMRPQIYSITDLTDFRNLGLPIFAIAIGLFLVYCLLAIVSKVIEYAKLEETHPAYGVDKKLTILKKRFKFNYVHQVAHFLSLPISLMFFIQIVSSSAMGLAVSIISLCLLLLIIAHALSLESKPYHRYFILMTLENVVIGGLAIWCSFSLYMGSLLVIVIFNLHAVKYVLSGDRMEWKLFFFVFIELFRAGIIITITICHFNAEKWDRNGLYLFGWLPVLLIFLYILLLAITVARDFFADEHSSNSSKNITKVNITEPTKQNKQNLLSQSHNRDFKTQQQDSIEQQSFFEDEEQVQSSSGASSGSAIIDFSSNSQNSDHRMAPKELIRYKK